MDLKKAFTVRPTNQEESEYMITIGNHLATEETFKSIEEAKERINSVDWNLVASLYYLLKEADKWEEIEKKNKEEKL